MNVSFLLVCEGSSDSALVHHIRKLLTKKCGATEADGNSFYHGTCLIKKMEQELELSSVPDLIFVHRDADYYRNTDAAGAEKRYQEIKNAVMSVKHKYKYKYTDRYVGIVPVRMTEAWLLVNECEIRRVAGQPRSRHDLHLPAVQRIEKIPDPKELLKKALSRAGLPKGVRRKKDFEQNFTQHRRQLIENLPVEGPLEHLRSWARFRDDTKEALRALRD